jgi:hypothetical protein
MRSATVFTPHPGFGPGVWVDEREGIVPLMAPIEFIPAAGAQAILPSIPTLERFLTAETGGRSGIRSVFRGSALVGFPWPCVTHDGPQQCRVVGEGLCFGPDTLSTTTAED